MSLVFAFDVYGTLINTQGLVPKIESMIGESATRFSTRWREKQLEYAFRRGLMQSYQDFSVCTKEALEYTCLEMETTLTQAQKDELIQAYGCLPAFDDVKPALTKLKAAGTQVYAFSNGTKAAVARLLEHAGLDDYFIDIVSVDELQTFKPNPSVYQLFLDKTGADKANTWLVSSNSFDLIGALSFGLNAAWVKRSDKAIFDPWGMTASMTLSQLDELSALVLS
ncbi:L-2-haloalkanoic acid dehalogenase, HAD superfamily protein [Marinomonas sp. MED121]|uniref:haloacid dehalogenase type II n=1 Tax=Marinomonas sp. MED121 TaxID=314277 RepID=UPI0000691180|nr:haloacid dehalogenase type II [Marinomonas sp. MED121]EAQ67626.1 L-2-haloalkanoic acid dehalogenase, HAD superfamily protein [Marinomonas sp. MED121]